VAGQAGLRHGLIGGVLQRVIERVDADARIGGARTAFADGGAFRVDQARAAIAAARVDAEK
jgi:hypothetical protein